VKRFFLFLVFTAFILTVYSQNADKNKCESIILDDSLFNKKTDSYNFDIVTNNIVHNVLSYQIENINDVITVDEDCLTFRISYGCGCGSNEKKLVSNGQIFRDNQGNMYYEIKLLFVNQNQGCEALCHDKLLFDISSLRGNTKVDYLKFQGFDNLIKF
jgi:hypothetical protein